MSSSTEICAVTWDECPKHPGTSHVCFLAPGHGHNHACVCGNTDLEPFETGSHDPSELWKVIYGVLERIGTERGWPQLANNWIANDIEAAVTVFFTTGTDR